jgi:hypothetical protein
MVFRSETKDPGHCNLDNRPKPKPRYEPHIQTIFALFDPDMTVYFQLTNGLHPWCFH